MNQRARPRWSSRLLPGISLLAVFGSLSASPFASRAAPVRDDFAPQVRLGFTSGDQWEPSIAADRSGHIYVFYAQYGGVPGCTTCFSPTGIFQMSQDEGASWNAPAVLNPAGSSNGQWDPQIVVDPVGGRTVYAAWLQDRKSDVVVARSDDFGASWGVVVASHTLPGLDKPILAVRGSDVYVSYNHAQKIWVSVSHDGGATFRQVQVDKGGRLGWALASGGVVDSAGNVYFAWAGYRQHGQAKGPVNLFLSRSGDGGATWTNVVVDISATPPDCSAFLCGWAYLGAQMAIAVDDSGDLYALWNANDLDFGPARMYFARSRDGGLTWSRRADVSLAPAGSDHAFPAIVAGATGDVRVAWMDNRAGGLWNTYFRRTADGGESWTGETDISTFVPGFSYIQPEGFGYPFGDYFELDIGGDGATHAVFGEGLNYDSPGSIWYTRGR